MRRLLLALAFVPGSALAQVVPPAAPPPTLTAYPGCASPPTTFNHVWHFDPVHGQTAQAMTDAGIPMPAVGHGPTSATQGSAEHPWSSIQAAFNSSTTPIAGYSVPLITMVPYYHPVTFTPENPGPNGETTGWSYLTSTADSAAGPIQPGDEILLASGDYGDLGIGYTQYKTVMNDKNGALKWITIAPAPDAKPVFTRVSIYSFIGASFLPGISVVAHSKDANNGGLLQFQDQGPQFPADNNSVSGMTIANDTGPSNSFTQNQMHAHSPDLIFGVGVAADNTNSKCNAVVNSHIYNVYNGMKITTSNFLFARSEIDHLMGGDSITFAGDNIDILDNYGHDNNNAGDDMHHDWMQGQTGRIPEGQTYVVYSNVIIARNKFIRQTDPSLPYPTGIQGIDNFSPSAEWVDLWAFDNVVVTDSCYGVAFGALRHGGAVGNTALTDGASARYSPSCSPSVGPTGALQGPHENSDQLWANNIAPTLGSGVATNTNIEIVHNLSTSTNGSGFYGYVDGVICQAQNPSMTPVEGCGNMIISGPDAEQSLFVRFMPNERGVIDPHSDFHLSPTSAAHGVAHLEWTSPLNGSGHPRSIGAGAY